MHSTKRKTLDEFIADARLVHGDKYDYSMVKTYVNNRTEIPIICPVHGMFMQTPHNHLQGQGCKQCGFNSLSKQKKGVARQNIKSVIYGCCCNDLETPVKSGTKKLKSYELWSNMIGRCYDVEYKKQKPTYENCMLCDEWHYFSNFKRWFDDPLNGYQDGYCLDKDILIKGNKLYSPETCCFVPNTINSLVLNRQNDRGVYPIGVKPHGNKFTSSVSEYGKSKHIGVFNSEKEAFYAYKKERERYIKEVAQEYFKQGKITENVYKALMNYKVEITD